MRVIALPESSFQIDLLNENCPEVVLYLIRRNSAAYEKNLPLDANFTYFEADEFSRNPLISIRRNRSFYCSLANLITDSHPEKLILFGDAKPYHKFIIDQCIINNISIELWEDGLFYYIGSGNKLKYITKNFIKAVFGGYARGLFSEQYRRSEITTRDRFIKKNLRYPIQSPSFERSVERIAFIGQPLVQDGYLSATSYASIIESICDQSGVMVDYLPHPREELIAFDNSKVQVIGGVSTQTYLRSVRYLHCTTAFSTAILNLTGDDRSFCPEIFGLKQVARQLAKFPELGVRVIRSFSEIGLHRR